LRRIFLLGAETFFFAGPAGFFFSGRSEDLASPAFVARADDLVLAVFFAAFAEAFGRG
jgi:hypothetical protein